MTTKRHFPIIPSIDQPSVKVFIKEIKDQSPFTRLPYEVIEHILTFLDYDSLMKCSLAHKRINNVIDTSLKLMKHFTVFVNTSHFKGSKALATLKRRHAKIVIDDIDFEEAEFMEKALRRVGKNVREAHIRCHISPNHPWILDYFPNVQKLEVDGYLHIQPATSSMLTNLKELRLKKCENISHFVNVRNLKQLRVFIDEETFGSFNELLNNQSAMDLLLVNTRTCSDRPWVNQLRLSFSDDFRVRCLFIESFSWPKLKKALKLALDFKNHIECLSLELSMNFHSAMVLDKVLDNFKTISALRLDISGLPSRKEFYTNEKANKKLTVLVLTSFDVCFFEDVTGLIGLFKIFPNLQHLTIPYIESDEETWISVEIPELNVKLRKLKSFTVAVRKVSDITLPTPTLSLMTSLFIDYNDYAVPWDVFSSNFPCLREISIINVESTLDLEFFLQSLRELTFLRLGNDFCLTLEALEVIKRCAPNLKTLRVSHWDDDVSLQGALMALDITQLGVTVAETPEHNFDAEFSLRGAFKIS